MHLAVYDAPWLPNPVLLRGWGGLTGLGQSPMQYYEDPVVRHGWGGLWGLGQAASGPPSAASIASVAASGAATTGAILSSMAATTGPLAGMLPASFALAGPIGAAVAGLTAVGIAIAKIFSGCGQTCVQATQIADQVDPYLAQNRDHYLSSPVRYKSMQAAAVNNFDTAWNALVQACSNPALAAAGQRCISDRQQGACVWKTSEGKGCASGVNSCWTQDASGNCTFNKGGAAGSGNACWNWWIGYRDPISNDPCVLPDPTPADVASGATAAQVSSATSATASSGSNMLPIALIGGAVLLMMGMSK